MGWWTLAGYVGTSPEMGAYMCLTHALQACRAGYGVRMALLFLETWNHCWFCIEPSRESLLRGSYVKRF